MTFYLDPNHPTKLLTAMESIYSLDRYNTKQFKKYDSNEYGKEQPGSVFFFVDEEKHGLELNTKRMVSEGYTVFAIKFPPGQKYVAFQVAEAFLKVWPRALKHIGQPGIAKVYKYHYQTDVLRLVE